MSTCAICCPIYTSKLCNAVFAALSAAGLEIYCSVNDMNAGEMRHYLTRR